MAVVVAVSAIITVIAMLSLFVRRSSMRTDVGAFASSRAAMSRAVSRSLAVRDQSTATQ